MFLLSLGLALCGADPVLARPYRLLVLDHGNLVEFDTPYNLLTKVDGEDAVFKGMVEKSGKFEELFASAEKKKKADEAAV